MAIRILHLDGAPSRVPPSGFRGLRILIAEDNPINQVVIASLLEELGCDTPDVAGDGREALDAFRAKEFDIVFMDSHMPNLDGYIATTRIRRLEAGRGGNRRCYIAAMTGDILPDVEEKCRAAGMDASLTKPYIIEDLVATLERARDRAAGGKSPADRIPEGSDWKGVKVDKGDNPDKGGTVGTVGTVDKSGGWSEWGDIDIRILDRLRLLGGKESPSVFRDLVRSFLETIPEKFSAIRELARAHDFRLLAFAAHGLKGLCLNFGAISMARECEALQVAAEGERPDGLPRLLERLSLVEARTRIFLEGMIGAATADAGTPCAARESGNSDG